MLHHVEYDLELLKNPYPGKIICIEGIDGSGKTTQAKELVKKLNKEGLSASYTKEPTDEIIGKFIRDNFLSGKEPINPLAFQYLINADRAMHLEKIEELLKKGYLIVMDRYFWSAVAYAMADMDPSTSSGHTMDEKLVMFSILSFYHQFLAPDFSFYLELSTKDAVERISKSEKHDEIYDKAEKLPKIEKAYENLVKEFPEEFTVVNGQNSQEEINNQIFEIVVNRL